MRQGVKLLSKAAALELPHDTRGRLDLYENYKAALSRACGYDSAEGFYDQSLYDEAMRELVKILGI